MSSPPHPRRPIPPNPPRWQPNPDPASINVPGLDTSAPVLDQIEQMDQLITIKLQNIDENFSKIHNVLANKLLPAVKRYAVGTEPVREAAKFWTSFYEQAAQIRIPTYDDYSSINEHQSQAGREEEQGTATQETESPASTSDSQPYESSMASTESSFMPGQAAYASTPATRNRIAQARDSFGSEGSDDPSWTASMESPLVRLDRQIQNFTRDDSQHPPLPTPSLRHEDPQVEPVTEPRVDKGKAKETPQPLLQNVLRHTLYSVNDMSPPDAGPSHVSPLKFRIKPKTPVVPKTLNPYLPPNTKPTEWTGLVDLSDPSFSTPQRYVRPSARRKPSTPAASEEDSFEGLPAGMSPPVMMSPARPPRSSAELGLLKLGKTPTKEAAARITRDLVSDIQTQRQGGGGGSRQPLYGYTHGHSGVESSMSTVPTPPSLSRYGSGIDTSDSMGMDSSLESMMQRVGLKPPSTAAYQPEPQAAPATPMQNQYLDDDSFSSDSLDEIHNTAHPSSAFLMASQGRPRGEDDDDDDSFGSSNRSGDSLDEEDAAMGLVPVHPFATSIEDNGFDDTFDEDEDDGFNDNIEDLMPGDTETLFGVPPQQRIMMEQARYRGDQLRILGDDPSQDTRMIGEQIDRVEETPTPWGGPRN